MNDAWSSAIIFFDYDDEDEGISMDIPIISSSSPLFIELDGNDIKAVADSIPRAIKPIPVILAIQRPIWSILYKDDCRK
jgi:hypothetical protein